MIRHLRTTIVGLLGVVTTAHAQGPAEPQMILSIGAGMATRGGVHWSLPAQAVQGSQFGADTLGLERWMRTGPVVALAVTYHPGVHLGYVAEAGYYGISTEQRCTPPAGGYQPDAERKNEQACVRANGSHVPTSVVGFQVGLAYRGSPDAAVTPHARIGLGVGFLANPFVRTVGAVQATTTCADLGGACEWILLDEASTNELTYLASLTAGVSFRLGPGYRFRFEVRDLAVGLPVPEGSGDAVTREAQIGTRMRHIPVITAGLDVVLERRRGRRY